jgi:hypothetical protein
MWISPGTWPGVRARYSVGMFVGPGFTSHAHEDVGMAPLTMVASPGLPMDLAFRDGAG